MELQKLKQANEIYQLMANKTIEQAMASLKTYSDLDQEVKQLVISLIKNAQQSSEFFDQKVAHHYNAKTFKVWQPGDIIGDYELLEPIGQGGMSTVFKAQRVNSDTQKPVAIKILSLENNTSELKAKYIAEQHILASLSHPNIIDFHHGENTEVGDAYIVMELLDEGLSIDAYCKQQQLGTKLKIALMIQATDAIQFAHNHLIIHSDLKPSNIMINNSGQLKVLDFGIAKLISPQTQGNDLHDEKAQQNTLLALTPSYASPEQINGHNIDVTTDVFSLAAVAVALITDQQPFPIDRVIKSCQTDTNHVRQLLKTHNVDKNLSNVLMKALHHDRTQRYANMFALREDFQAWMAQKPVTASGDSWWYRLQCFAKRRTALFSLSIVLLLTVTTAIVGLSWQNQAIKMEAQKADAVKQFMLDSFSVTDPNISQGIDLSTKDLLRLAAQKIDEQQNIDSYIHFELYQAMAKANGRLGYYTEAIELLEKALKIQTGEQHSLALLAQYYLSSGKRDELTTLLANIQENLFDSPTDRAMFKRVRVLNLAQAGDYEQALSHFGYLDQWIKGPLDEIKNQAVLAEVYYLKGQSEKSIEIIETVKKAHPLPETHVLNLGLNTDLVEYHDRIGNFTEALDLTKQNIALYQKILGDQHPNLGQAYNALSVFQRLAGDLSAALSAAEQSKTIFRQRYGDSSEGLSQALSNAGMAYYYLDKPDKAIEEFTASADMLIKIFSAQHPEAINAQANLAMILNATGHPEQALPQLQEIYNTEVQTLGATHRSPLMTQQALALTLSNLSQHDEAIRIAQENLSVVKQNFASRDNMLNGSVSILARVLFNAEQYETALPHFMSVIESSAEGNQNNKARFLKYVAKSHAQLNNSDQANQFYQQWTDQLQNLYGVTDPQYLQALLDWAQWLTQVDQASKASELINQVSDAIENHDIKTDALIQHLSELNLNSNN